MTTHHPSALTMPLSRHTRRRAFITLLGGAAAWPLAAHAQEAGRIYRLGFLTGRPRAIREYDAFFDEMRRDGFIEGQNLIVDARGFGLRPEQFAEIAAALARSNPDVIFSAGGDPSMHALKAATQTVRSSAGPKIWWRPGWWPRSTGREEISRGSA